MNHIFQTWDPITSIWLIEFLGFHPKKLFQGMAPRHMQHTTMEAFYETYLLWCDGKSISSDDRAKIRCFTGVFESKWQTTLKFWTVSQHARQLTCSKLSLEFKVKSIQSWMPMPLKMHSMLWMYHPNPRCYFGLGTVFIGGWPEFPHQECPYVQTNPSQVKQFVWTSNRVGEAQPRYWGLT